MSQECRSHHSLGGQSLLEFTLSVWGLVAFCGVAAAVIRASWLRAECAYEVFERTHHYLVSQGVGSEWPARISPQRRIRFHVTSTPHGVQGSGVCGGIIEKVELPWLESAVW